MNGDASPGERGSSSVRVVLRDVIADDLPVFFDQQQDPEATKMANFAAREREAFFAHWTTILADESGLKQTILAAGQVAGNIVLFGPEEEREIGYWLGRAV